MLKITQLRGEYVGIAWVFSRLGIYHVENLSLMAKASHWAKAPVPERTVDKIMVGRRGSSTQQACN